MLGAYLRRFEDLASSTTSTASLELGRSRRRARQCPPRTVEKSADGADVIGMWHCLLMHALAGVLEKCPLCLDVNFDAFDPVLFQ